MITPFDLESTANSALGHGHDRDHEQVVAEYWRQSRIRHGVLPKLHDSDFWSVVLSLGYPDFEKSALNQSVELHAVMARITGFPGRGIR